MKEIYMELALDLAQKALGKTSPNPLVGAVVVNNNKIVGQGYHVRAGNPHAEKMALKEAGEKAQGADLYVTLEPCNHYGRTPPCTEAIIEAKIKNVYIATLDPNPLVAGKGVKRLKDEGINVVVGIKEKEAQLLNEVYFKYITTGLPFVALKAACSLDGKIATREGHSQWITGEKAREYGHKLRNTYDAIMVGIGTVLADDPRLTCRLENGRDPIRIIIDSKLSISPDAQILNLKSSVPTLIATTQGAPLIKQKELAKKAEVLIVNEGDKVDLLQLLKILGQREITSILVEGGATLNGTLVNQRLIDKFYLFYAPILIGGLAAPGFMGGIGCARLENALKLKNITIQTIGSDFLITGYPDV
jgi:diaminohydroxyphosphoribosylaminopyrimidine deaminase/5-amino-6-(5-phosphoribosylamino)uracil reductase